jgi:hypothetical protein
MNQTDVTETTTTTEEVATFPFSTTINDSVLQMRQPQFPPGATVTVLGTTSAQFVQLRERDLPIHYSRLNLSKAQHRLVCGKLPLPAVVVRGNSSTRPRRFGS